MYDSDRIALRRLLGPMRSGRDIGRSAMVA
jgi:hypothetical protein